MVSQKTFLASSFVLTLLFVMADMAPNSVFAQGYPAYGAWRGRARTVETPNYRRTHVRWGNGVTPTGATMMSTILTDPNFWGGIGGVVGLGRSDERLMVVSDEDLEALRAGRALQRQMEERARMERSQADDTIRETLAQHREILDRLQGTSSAPPKDPSSSVAGLEARTQRFLADVKEIHATQGASPKLPAAREEGPRLQQRYRDIHEALRETNAALEALEKARAKP